MKLIGAVLGFDLGTENDNDMNMETDAKPMPTRKETPNTKTEQNQVRKTYLSYLFKFGFV
jgi:hypothetical protein